MFEFPFLEEDMMAECSASLIIKEDATPSHEIPLCTLTRMLIIKTRKPVGVSKDPERREPSCIAGGMVQRPRATVRVFFEKLPQRAESRDLRTRVHGGAVRDSRGAEASQVSTDG